MGYPGSNLEDYGPFPLLQEARYRLEDLTEEYDLERIREEVVRINELVGQRLNKKQKKDYKSGMNHD